MQHERTPWSIPGNPRPVFYPRPGGSRAFCPRCVLTKPWGCSLHIRLFLVDVFNLVKDFFLPAKRVTSPHFVASGSSHGPFWWSWRRISSSALWAKRGSSADSQDEFCGWECGVIPGAVAPLVLGYLYVITAANSC